MNPNPRHVAIIMDGNGRWARKRGLPRLAGHREGAQSVSACVEGASACNIEFLTLYAFSSENWKRPKNEVDGLMELLDRFLREKTKEMIEKDVRLKVIGRTHDLPKANRDRLEKSLKATENNKKLTIILALSYGGRQEIVDATRSLVRDALSGKIKESDIDEQMFASRLYTSEFPDPELIIRTSGEMRLSNFLLWQSSYSEWVVVPKLWPEFRKDDFLTAIENYRKRERRFGGV